MDMFIDFLLKRGLPGIVVAFVIGLLMFNIGLLDNPILSDSIEHNLQFRVLVPDSIDKLSNNSESQQKIMVAVVLINAGTKALTGVSGEIYHPSFQIAVQEENNTISWRPFESYRGATFKLQHSLMPGSRSRIQVALTLGSKSGLDSEVLRRSITAYSEEARGYLVEKEHCHNEAAIDRIWSSLIYINLLLLRGLLFPFGVLILVGMVLAWIRRRRK